MEQRFVLLWVPYDQDDTFTVSRTGFSQAICAPASWILARSASSLVLNYPSMIGVSISPMARAPPRLERLASVLLILISVAAPSRK